MSSLGSAKCGGLPSDTDHRGDLFSYIQHAYQILQYVGPHPGLCAVQLHCRFRLAHRTKLGGWQSSSSQTTGAGHFLTAGVTTRSTVTSYTERV